jgi:hypothetical protein
MYPPHDEVAQAHQAALREEVAQRRMARQVRMARQAPSQTRGDTLLDWGRGVIARLRAAVVA